MKIRIVDKKLKNKIAREFNMIMGIVSEGLGSQYKVFIKTETTIWVLPKRNKCSKTFKRTHISPAN